MTKIFSLKDTTQKFKLSHKALAALLLAFALAAFTTLAYSDPIAQVAMATQTGSPIRSFLNDGPVLNSKPEHRIPPLNEAPLDRSINPKVKTSSKPPDGKAQKAYASWIVQSTKNKVPLNKATKIVDAVYGETQGTQIDPVFILGLIRAESHFNHKAANSYGARGLMQVVPRWHRDKLKGQDPFDVYVNVRVGVQVYKDCLTKFKSEKKALACYSGGAGTHYHKRIAQTKTELMSHALNSNYPLPQALDDPLFEFIKEIMKEQALVYASR